MLDEDLPNLKTPKGIPLPAAFYPLNGGAEMLMTGKTHQFEALQRIAAFAAKVRGHQLAVWRTSASSSTARCAKCGRAVTVYTSFLQPDMEGPALASLCGESAAEEAA